MHYKHSCRISITASIQNLNFEAIFGNQITGPKGPHHIRIIPMPWAGVGLELVLVLSIVSDDPQHALPAVVDVVIVTPQVAHVGNLRVIRLSRKCNHLTMYESC